MRNQPEFPTDLDVVALEREARQMQARVVAQSARALRNWIAAKLTGTRSTGAKAAA